jgi:putative membrane protein
LIGIGFASLVLNNIQIETFLALMVSAIVLTLFQTFLRPILLLLTLPFQVLSLGLGYILINSLLLKITADFLSGLTVEGFWTSFFGAIFISIVNVIFDIFSSSSNSKVKIYYHKSGDDD